MCDACLEVSVVHGGPTKAENQSFYSKTDHLITHGSLIPDSANSVFFSAESKFFMTVNRRSVQAASSTSDVLPDDEEAVGNGRMYSEMTCSASALIAQVNKRTAQSQLYSTHLTSRLVVASCKILRGIHAKCSVAPGSPFSLSDVSNQNQCGKRYSTHFGVS